MYVACADPESFLQTGSNFDNIVLDEETQMPLKVDHHWPASETPNIECWFGSFVIFQQIQPSTAMKPFILWFYGGVWTPCPHLWIRPCVELDYFIILWKYALTMAVYITAAPATAAIDAHCGNPVTVIDEGNIIMHN